MSHSGDGFLGPFLVFLSSALKRIRITGKRENISQQKHQKH